MSNSETAQTTADAAVEDAAAKALKKQASTAVNDPDRFKFGVLIRAKFIGVEDVKKETGDDVCQTSMVKLKAVVLAKKEHKRRICVKVNLDGVEIVDEKTNESLYTHSVNRISYIARDINDPRAIGYIYKNGNNEFQYFAIKTIGQAQELFNTLKDLFEVVLEMRNQKKKQETEESSSNNKSDEAKGEEEEEANNNLTSQLSAENTEDLEKRLTQMKEQEQQNSLLDIAFDAPVEPPKEEKKESILDEFGGLDLSTPAAAAPAATSSASNDLFNLFDAPASKPAAPSTGLNAPTTLLSNSSNYSALSSLSSPSSPFGGQAPFGSPQPPNRPPLPPFPSQMGSPMMMGQPQANPMMMMGQPFQPQQQQPNPFGNMMMQQPPPNQFGMQPQMGVPPRPPMNQQQPAQRPTLSPNFPF